MSKQCAVYDFSVPVTLVGDHSKLIEALKGWAKKFVFQKEEGDGGYLHYQGRLSLIKKRRKSELLTLWKDHHIFSKWHYSPSSNNSLQGECFYVVKVDTRVEGPWKDTDPVKIVTPQLAMFNSWELWPYQQKLVEMVKPFSMRDIICVYDPKGYCGKSLFCEYLEYNDLAFEVPPFTLMEDLMQCVMSVEPKPKALIIDMPRAMSKKHLSQFYAGIECLKNGVAYDKRYKFRKVRFRRPAVVVFTNSLPDTTFLSADRWKVFQIMENDLVRIYLN